MGAALSYDYGSQNGYGGWLADRRATTGSTPTFTGLIGWAAALGSVACTGTGGDLSIDWLQLNSQQVVQWAPRIEMVEVVSARSPVEDLESIRQVIRPAISDLAMAFGVSRQSIYNWINGEQVSEEYVRKLRDLAQASDVLALNGLGNTPALLKRKFVNGRTLMQVVQQGGSAADAAQLLVRIHKREEEQRLRMRARFEGRARSPTTADFDLPAPNDAV